MIIEEQPIVRKVLQMMLSTELDLIVVVEPSDSKTTLELAASLHPDVVLIDVDTPNIDGIATASALCTACPGCSVIILSINDDALSQACAREAGATAFVSKSLPTATLLETIRRVSQGDCFAYAKYTGRRPSQNRGDAR